MGALVVGILRDPMLGPHVKHMPPRAATGHTALWAFFRDDFAVFRSRFRFFLWAKALHADVAALVISRVEALGLLRQHVRYLCELLQ